MKPIISVKEARKLLGIKSSNLTDDQIAEIVETLDLLAKDSLEKAKVKVEMKSDAKELAKIVYDIYEDKKRDIGNNA